MAPAGRRRRGEARPLQPRRVRFHLLNVVFDVISHLSASKTFEFISSGPVGKPDPGVRKFIRSHVMRGKNRKRRESDTQRNGVVTKHLSVSDSRREGVAINGHLSVSESPEDGATKGHLSLPQSRREHIATKSHLSIPKSHRERVAAKTPLSVSESRRGHVASTHTETKADTLIQFEGLPGLFRVPCDLRLFNFSSPLDETSRHLIFRCIPISSLSLSLSLKHR